MKAEIEKLGLQAVALARRPTLPKHAVNLPRLAVFSTWGSTQDVGWVRYAFDHFEVPYDLIYKERIRKGNLRAAYDVIVIPSQGRGGAKSLVFDIEPRAGKPSPTTRRPNSRRWAMYGESEDITGGMGLQGVAELDKFVNEGGVLITLGAASFLPADFGITRDRRCGAHVAAVLRARPDRGGGDPAARHIPSSTATRDALMPVRWAGGPLLRVAGRRPPDAS